MARTNPSDGNKLKAMLDKRLRQRSDPFPEGRGATLDDIVFLPANLSRLVIDPYREACKISTDLGGKIDLEIPFLVGGFDNTSTEIKSDLAAGLGELGQASRCMSLVTYCVRYGGHCGEAWPSRGC